MYSPSLRKILRLFALCSSGPFAAGRLYAAALSFRNFPLTFDQRIIMAQRFERIGLHPQQNRRQKCRLAANTLVR